MVGYWMLVPKVLVARPDEALDKARLLYAALKKGQHVGELVSLDTEGISIAVDGPNPLTKGKKAFQAWALPRIAMQLDGQQGVRTLADQLLRLDWGGLALLGQDSMFLVRQDNYASRLLTWLREQWSSLLAIQGSFPTPVNPDNTLWDPPSNLHRAAGHLGISDDRLFSPGSEGFLAILDELKASKKL